MIEQEVTYSTVRFHKSSGSQNQKRPEETQDPREAGHRECSVPWHLIMIAFGVPCALLLITVAVLLTSIFQYSQEKHELQETLTNLHHNCSTMQNDIDLNDELLRNKTIEHRAGNELLDSLNREQKRWHSETKTVLDSSLHTGRGIEIHWFCYGIKCYYFIMDRKTWSGCKQTCVNKRLSLLKIDDEDELKFLQLQIFKNSYWIGLSYDKTKDWAWLDNGPSKLYKDIENVLCVSSDHHELKLHFNSRNTRKPTPSWKLNKYLLNDLWVRKERKKEIKYFPKFNESEATTHSNLRDIMKAVLEESS